MDSDDKILIDRLRQHPKRRLNRYSNSARYRCAIDNRMVGAAQGVLDVAENRCSPIGRDANRLMNAACPHAIEAGHRRFPLACPGSGAAALMAAISVSRTPSTTVITRNGWPSALVSTRRRKQVLPGAPNRLAAAALAAEVGASSWLNPTAHGARFRSMITCIACCAMRRCRRCRVGGAASSPITFLVL